MRKLFSRAIVVVRVVAAALLITAAAMKAIALQGWSDYGYVALIVCEFVLGIQLALNSFPRAALWLAAFTFSIFACVALTKALSGDASCGCFGAAPIRPWVVFGVDVVTAVALTCAVLRDPSKCANRWPWQQDKVKYWALGSSIVAALLFIAGRTSLTHMDTVISGGRTLIVSGNAVVCDPFEWVNERLPLLPYIDIGHDLQDGRWRIVVLRSGCSKCNAVAKRLFDSSLSTNEMIALIEIQSDASAEASLAGSFPRGPIRLGRLSVDKQWVIETPVELLVVDGVVNSVTTTPDMSDL
jgi:hypothetical protein